MRADHSFDAFESEQLLPIDLEALCDCFGIAPELLADFAAHGLFTLSAQAGRTAIEAEDLAELESLIRLHQSFGLSPEALDIIRHLRRRVSSLDARARQLEQRLERARQARRKAYLLIEVEAEG